MDNEIKEFWKENARQFYPTYDELLEAYVKATHYHFEKKFRIGFNHGAHAMLDLMQSDAPTPVKNYWLNTSLSEWRYGDCWQRMLAPGLSNAMQGSGINV